MINLDQARHFVHANGVLWVRTLWDYLFADAPLARVHQAMLVYRNPDAGWGYGLETDIKCPESNPLQLEFLLSVLKATGLPAGRLLDGAAAWVQANRAADGSLMNPPTLHQHPHAPWWSAAGQSHPDAITGNLIHFGAATPALVTDTTRWVAANVTLEKIRENEWLFMAYHTHDFFMNVADYPNLTAFRQATLENIIACARRHEAAGEMAKNTAIFDFAPTPESPTARALPADILERTLDYVASSQREDGGWADEHDLAYWQPYHSTKMLLILQRYGRL